MVKIVCRPPKEVIFLECTKYPSVEALSTTIATIIRTGEPMVLKWAEAWYSRIQFCHPQRIL